MKCARCNGGDPNCYVCRKAPPVEPVLTCRECYERTSCRFADHPDNTRGRCLLCESNDRNRRSTLGAAVILFTAAVVLAAVGVWQDWIILQGAAIIAGAAGLITLSHLND